MLGIVGLAAFLTVLGLSMVITRIATVALTLTGMSRQAARFQARSAFTGTGFTTSEAEQILNHPVRRRVVMFLMVTRSAGLVSIVISLILTFGIDRSGAERLHYLLFLLTGVFVLWLLTRSKICEKYMNAVIKAALQKWTDIDVRDYASLLNLSGQYGVTEFRVNRNSWMAGKRLRDMDLLAEGIMALGVNRSDGSYTGVPTGDSKIYPGDTLILYGRGAALNELTKRKPDVFGDASHRSAVDEQNREMVAQSAREKAHEERCEQRK